MSSQIPVDDFRGELLNVLDEIFEHVHGYLLDPGDSMFETLSGISADEASIPVSKQSASLAAQVNHVRFYLDALADGISGQSTERPDWASSWAITSVTEDEWRDLIARLRTTYENTRTFAENFDAWDGRFVGGAFAMVGHCAYHLGEIRQGIGVIRSQQPSV